MSESVAFEAVRVAFRQDKDGYLITLRIHPDDISDQIMTDRLGQRYGVALVAINDEPSPPVKRELRKLAGREDLQSTAVRLFRQCATSPSAKNGLTRLGYIHSGAAESVGEALLEYLSARLDAPITTQAAMRRDPQACVNLLQELLDTDRPPTG